MLTLPRFFCFYLLLISIISCNKYNRFYSNYKVVHAEMDYSNLDNWAAHPWKWDPSDSVPAPLRHEPRDTSVDVFFLHPTTYTSLKRMNGDNADPNDVYTLAKTDYSTILYQASAFNQHARVFAPRYRQAHIEMFYEKDKDRAAKAFDIAYDDLKTAFIYYLDHWNNGRPFIIAAHSQGSYLGEKLIKEFFETPSSPYYTFRKKMIVAYIIGWPVPKEYFPSIPICADSLQTNCICSWRTLRNGFIPSYLKDEQGNALATNPLNWNTNNDYAGKNLNYGSVLTRFNKIYPHTTDAKIHNGLLWVARPRFPGSFLYTSRNYHIADINLYYINIRINVEQRIRAFLQNQPH
jgi:hypothetical protein